MRERIERLKKLSDDCQTHEYILRTIYNTSIIDNQFPLKKTTADVLQLWSPNRRPADVLQLATPEDEQNTTKKKNKHNTNNHFHIKY